MALELKEFLVSGPAPSLTIYMKFRKIVLMNPFMRQQWSHIHIENRLVDMGWGRRGWTEWRQ